MTLRTILAQAQHWLTAPPAREAQASDPIALAAKASQAAAARMRYVAGVEHYPPREYKTLLPYARTNPIVRRALKLTSEAVAQLRPDVFVAGKLVEEGARVQMRRGDGRQGMARLDILNRILDHPNPDQDFSGFIARLVSFYKASGNGWVEFVPGLTGDYAQFYALRPDHMTIKPGPDGWPAEYAYQAGTGAIKRWGVDIERGKRAILHIKDDALDDDLFGRGALEAADKPLRIYEAAQQLAASQFENGAAPAGAFVWDPSVPPGAVQPTLTPAQQQEFEQRVNDKLRGPKNRGKFAIFSGGWRWEPVGMSMVDLEAMEIRFAAARDIALAFGVPPMLLGIPGDNTYANFSEASRAFYRSSVLADAKRVYGALARWLSQISGIERLELVIDEEKIWALADELTLHWQRTLAADVLTFEEKREALGYERSPPDKDHFFDSSFGGALAPVRALLAGDYANGLQGPVTQARMLPPLEEDEAEDE